MSGEKQLKILIADDHFLIRQFVKRTLMEMGMNTIDMVVDGTEAIDAINQALSHHAPYDVIFLDWNMPVMNGIDVLTYVRGKPQYGNAAVVMFTAESEKTHIMKAIKQGATTYILKPISPMDLNKKVREVLDWLKSRREGKV